VRVSVWEPDVLTGAGAPDAAGASGALPLVLLSHGTGGSVAWLEWLAEALRRRGAIVVGVDHHGNTAVEAYLPEGFSMVWNRPLDLSFALDWALGEYHVDSERVVAAGFSLGGYTVAALAGARFNREVLTLVLTGAIPTPPLPEFPDLVDQLLARYGVEGFREIVAAAPDSLRDARVRRIAMLAPAIGPLVDAGSLAEVSVPALVLWGEADDIAEPATNARVYAAGIPGAVGRSLGPVDHWVFLDELPGSGVELSAVDGDPGDAVASDDASIRAGARDAVADFLLGDETNP